MTVYVATSETGAGTLLPLDVDDDGIVPSSVVLVAQSGAAISDASTGTVDVYGLVYGNSGINLSGINSRVFVGATGTVSGGVNASAISLGSGTEVNNYGTITDTEGTAITGNASVFNYGTIQGDLAISGASELVNYGTITGQYSAFRADNATYSISITNNGIITGDVDLAGTSVFNSSLGTVYGSVFAGTGNATIIAGTNGGAVYGNSGNDKLYANQSQTAADNAAQFTLDGTNSGLVFGGDSGGTNALYGGGAFNAFLAGDLLGGRNQIHGGASKMATVAGYSNNTLDFTNTPSGRSVYVDLLSGHNAFLYANASHSGALTFEDSIQNVPNVIGSNGGDLIRADNGTDVIQGGVGADILYAGTGFDTFVYKGYADSNTPSGYDTISGFVTGKDKIDLSALNSDPSHLAITSSGSGTTFYLEATPGKFVASTDLAISFQGANAIKASDVIF